MRQYTSYKVKIKDYNKIFKPTVELYRSAVDFFIGVISDEWQIYEPLKHSTQATNLTESLTIRTSKRPDVKYPFDTKFYKFPSYLRRAAIAEAYGKMSSYKSNLANWEKADRDTRGKCPSFPKAGYVYPAMYRDNMFVKTGTYTAEIKVFIRNTWDWLSVEFKKSDIDYILHHCGSRSECVPTLQKKGKEWFLVFGFEEIVSLKNLDDINNTVALAVDLGINHAATCSVMRSNGTIIGRRTLKLPREEDCLTHALNRIKKAQQHGARKMPRLWARATGISDDIAVKTANFIMDTARQYDCDVIVFEHLDTKGKKRGSGKQRLHHWRCQYVQKMVMSKAHREGMHVSTICAWGTSRLAYDGSGAVQRGSKAGLSTYSLCKFSNGKVYDSDLSATYNIGARYFIREILKSLPETARLDMTAKVPECSKRSTCTYSSLINLNAVIAA